MDHVCIHGGSVCALGHSTLSLTEPLRLLASSIPLTDGRFQAICISSTEFLALKQSDMETIVAWGSVRGREVELKRISDLNVQRRNPGIVFWSGRVYVFGGIRETETVEILADAEVYNTSLKSTWSEFPPMLTPRCYFTPCTHNADIYLCGGLTSSCEKLSPSTQSYSQLWLLLPEFDGSAHCAFIVENDLIILSRHWVLRWQCGEDEYECNEIDEIRDAAAITEPLVRGEKAAFAVNGAIVKFNLRKMKVCWHEM